MREHTVKVYEFSELKPEVQAKVLDRERDINTDGDYWSEETIQDAKEELEGLGYECVRVLYSGFGSQGDGACFTARVNMEEWLGKHKLKGKYKRALSAYREWGASIEVKHTYRYYFATSTTVETSCDGRDDKTVDEVEAIAELIRAERETLGNKLYRELETVYFSLTSDEEVRESIEANGYEYEVNGRRI